MKVQISRDEAKRRLDAGEILIDNEGDEWRFADGVYEYRGDAGESWNRVVYGWSDVCDEIDFLAEAEKGTPANQIDLATSFKIFLEAFLALEDRILGAAYEVGQDPANREMQAELAMLRALRAARFPDFVVTP